MTSGPGGAREVMRVMRERYRANSGAIVASFVALAAEVSRSPEAPATIEAVRREAHRIHGTAGTYGFAEASRVAAELERRCGVWAADPAADRDRRAEIVEQAAAALEAAFAAPDGAGPAGA